MSKTTSLRLDEDLLEWATEYAKQRGVTRTDLLEGALRNFREDCEAGVPEIKAAVKHTHSSVKTDRGVGDCPKREGDLGHVWLSWKVDPFRSCEFCGMHGREPSLNSGVDGPKGGGFFAQACAERAELFSKLRQPASVKVWGKA